MKVYLIAGEPSGDLLGSRFMKEMRKKNNGKVEFFGVGGDTMEAEGLHPLFDISDLAIMGLVEVVPSIPRVLKRIRETVKDIVRVQPDVVITIDSWSFSSRVHKVLRKLKTGIPQVHYVAPQVWAWKKKRAKTMYKYIDYLLTLFPYEPKYFTPYKLDAQFVGHPVIESEVVMAKGDDFRAKYNIPADKKIISVLPGSRKTEVSKLLPVFIDAAKELVEQDESLFFVIPTVKTVSKLVRDGVSKTNLPFLVVETQEDRYGAFRASDAAIAASGTVALELAICDIPHIIAYKVSSFSAMLVRKFLHIEFVNLSNILLGREIVPELLQERCVSGNIRGYIANFLQKGDLYEKQISGFAKVREVLGQGVQTPSQNACDIVINIINEHKK